MKARLCSFKQILIMAGVILLPFHGQSAEMFVVDDQACSTLQSCVDKYQRLLPEWQHDFERFGDSIDQQLPEIEKDLKAFGETFSKEGESQLRQWIDELQDRLPHNASDPALPERIWI